jgi:eukaryotic-like serine/threonine-protein kinase
VHVTVIDSVIDDKYRIVRMIGEGGMGAVYEGENVLIGRRVAIKVLHAAMALNPETVERFQREARAAGRIGNDHILEVLDLGTLPDGDRYMVLEFLDGEPLSSRIERLGKMDPREVAALTTQLLNGLAAAHRAGIVHRDLKPDNVFVLKEKAGKKDFVKIIDFGISKFSPIGGDDKMKMTQTGAIMGTPYYMSPEQVRGSVSPDARSDLYAVGVILYEAVTGNVPFNGNTVNELMFNIALGEPTPIRSFVPDLDPDFEAIILRALVKDREERFQTADDFNEAITKWMAGHGSGVVAPETLAIEESRLTSTGVVPAAKISQGGSTGVIWAQTGSGGAPVRTGMSMTTLAVAGLLGVLVLGGGGYATYRATSGDADAASADTAAAAAPAEALVEPAPPAEPPAPVVAPVPEPPPVQPTPEEKPAEPEKVEAEDRKPEPAVAAASPRPRPVAAAPRKTAPAPAPAPAPATAKPEAPKKTVVQFGY